MISQPRQLLTSVCIVAILSVTTGCGKGSQVPARASISGTVQLDGQPIEQGSIVFMPGEGVRGVAAGGAIHDGHYRLSSDKGPTLGLNRVEIRAIRKSGRKVPKPMAPAGEMIDEMVESVATRFNSESTLKTEITSGDNAANFEVGSK